MALFGNVGSNSAVMQQALAGLIAGSTKVPDLQDLNLQGYDTSGFTPQTVDYAGNVDVNQMNPTELRNILTNPDILANQQYTMNQLKDVSSQGMTAIDRARLQDIQNQIANQNQANQQSILQSERQRGFGGSGSELASQLLAQQSTANQANQMGMDVNAQAQARALQALSQLGGYTNDVSNLQFNQAAQKAAAQDAINQFNTQNLNQGNLYNRSTQQDLNSQNAQILNQANMYKNQLGNQNVDILNQQQQYNKVQKPMNIFGMQSGNAQAIAQGLSNSAQMSNQNKANQYNANTALAGAGLQAAGTLGAGALMA